MVTSSTNLLPQGVQKSMFGVRVATVVPTYHLCQLFGSRTLQKTEQIFCRIHVGIQMQKRKARFILLCWSTYMPFYNQVTIMQGSELWKDTLTFWLNAWVCMGTVPCVSGRASTAAKGRFTFCGCPTSLPLTELSILMCIRSGWSIKLRYDSLFYQCLWIVLLRGRHAFGCCVGPIW